MSAGEQGTVSLCLMKSDEAQATVEWLAATASRVTIEDRTTFYKITAPGRIVIDLDEIGERLGRALSIGEFLVGLSTYVGRVLLEDRRFILSAALLQLVDEE